MQMTFSSRSFILTFLYTFVWNLACISFSLSNTDELSEIQCLRSIQNSLEDPLNYLTMWNFDNQKAGNYSCKFIGVECWNAEELRILNIKLNDMGLMREFPRGLENCKSLAGLDLAGNKLFGPIPLDLCQKLLNLASLDLSNNTFSGEIPSTLANFKYLNSLSLSYNQLKGQTPQQLGQLGMLKVFNVSNNQLSGPLPEFVHFVSVSPDIYANNKGLCGVPLKPCKGKESGLKFDFSFESGFVAGFMFSSISIITSFVFCVFWAYLEGKNIRTRPSTYI